MTYFGHADYSSGPLRGVDGANLAPADRGADYDASDFFENVDPNDDSVGAAAYRNGYPRTDGQPASSGHFGPS